MECEGFIVGSMAKFNRYYSGRKDTVSSSGNIEFCIFQIKTLLDMQVGDKILGDSS